MSPRFANGKRHGLPLVGVLFATVGSVIGAACSAPSTDLQRYLTTGGGRYVGSGKSSTALLVAVIGLGKSGHNVIVGREHRSRWSTSAAPSAPYCPPHSVVIGARRRGGGQGVGGVGPVRYVLARRKAQCHLHSRLRRSHHRHCGSRFHGDGRCCGAGEIHDRVLPHSSDVTRQVRLSVGAYTG